MAMHFGSPTQKKFYYGKEGNSAVNQETFWKQTTKREWKITGAKERGYAGEIDQRKIDQMRAFLHHRCCINLLEGMIRKETYCQSSKTATP